MSASPLYKITFTDGSAVELRANVAVRRQGFGATTTLLVRDLAAGDLLVTGQSVLTLRKVERVERLPPRHAGCGGRRQQQ